MHGAGNHRLSTDSEGEGWEKGEGGVGGGEQCGGGMEGGSVGELEPGRVA